MMYFLKCSKCGFLNEVNSETLLFCNGCNKKLDNNFRDWQSRNPEKSFGDFKSILCITQEQTIQKPVQKRKVSTGLIIVLSVILLIAISATIGIVFSDQIVKKFTKAPSSSGVQQSDDWTTQNYGIGGLSVSTPFKLNPQQIPFPEEVQNKIENSAAYNSGNNESVNITISTIRYKPTVGQVNLKGAANGAVNNIKYQPGVTDFDYKEEAATLDGIPGIKQKGSFSSNGALLDFINVIYSRDFDLYQVIIIYRTNDENGRQIAEKVIQSISIQKK